MNNLNYIFLEEYKKLDKLCKEIYNSEKGITSYIDDMRNTNYSEKIVIPCWEHDIHTLVSLRHARNKLTHEVGTSDSPICTYADIDWLKNFYHRIVNRQDPIAIIHKNRYAKKQNTQIYTQNQNIQTSQSKKSKSNNDEIYLAIMCIIIILAIIFLTNHLF